MNNYKNKLITKEKIKYYLNQYPYLNSQIRQRELSHIKYGPSLSEFKQNVNTIENQIIAMENDSVLQEMKFYKSWLDRLLYILKITESIKYYNFVSWNYFKKLPKREIQKKLGHISYDEINDIVINYFYLNMLMEADNYGKQNKLPI